MKWPRRVVDFVIPVLVAVLLVWLVHISLQQSTDLANEGRAAKVQACTAVAQSDHALTNFLIAQTKRAHRYSGANKQFLDDLASAQRAAEKQCLLPATVKP